MLSNILELTLRKALHIASIYRHEYATYEHLLLALMEDKDAKLVLMQKGIDPKTIGKKLIFYLKKGLLELVNEDTRDSKPTAGFQRIVQRAALHSQTNGQRPINGADVLAEFFFENDSYALNCLKQANLKRSDVLNYNKRISNTSSTVGKDNFNDRTSNKDTKDSGLAISHKLKLEINPEEVASSQNSAVNTPEAWLEKYCINLNKKASEDDIDCLIGRHTEIQRTIEILCRRKKNNAVLVGESGVGKTAIAEGLAIRIIKGDVPDMLKNAVIYSLDIGSLVAGTKFRGDFEERIKVMLECLKKLKNAILFIDEIHSIIGAGSTTTGALDASNLLKPALANGGLRCIGATTFKEYRNNFEKDMALVRRFQKVIVEEPSEEATFNILNGLKGYYEEHHRVTYTEPALKAAISLSERYINERHLPDKAIDLIDEAGARAKTKKSDHKKAVITEKDIEDLVGSILNISNLNSAVDDIKQIRELEGKLKNSIFGQDEAIESLCASIKLSKAGLKKLVRPTGCYLFVGSTGVGKTELAKQLALFCDMKLLKYDMSEFAEASSVSKLLGSSPGYVGFDQGGMLTEEVDKYPYSVVLFDEIEKANNEIYNLLLQIMDEGVLTDSTGKKVKFSNCIIILTSNVSAQKIKPPIGFSSNGSELQMSDQFDMEAINSEFSSEFRSRLDKIILFNPIDTIVDKIVGKSLEELTSQLADRKVRFSVSDAVKQYLIKNYNVTQSGARALDRVIDIQIKQHIADAILFGKLKNGGFVEIDYSPKYNKITFKFTGVNKKPSQELETN
jgi:ATP-dependent Clp protease ATP-binding subunit ClpA